MSQELFIKLNRTKTLPNITTLIHHAIVITEKQKHITGREKKQFCLDIIHNTIELLPEDDNKTFLTTNYENGNIADLIDLVVDASKGKIDINKKVNLFLKCLLSCINSRIKPE
jgi:hypothetical protein